MLMITRRPDETFMLQDRETGELIAEVMVCRVDGNRVRLGIDAPQRVHVTRPETKGDDDDR